MKHFNVEPDTLNKGKFIVTMYLTIYRQKLGCYPNFLSDFGTPDKIRDGFTTKFWFLAKDEQNNPLENLNEEEATKIANRLSASYDEIIDKCEDTGDWSTFMFQNCELIYHK